MAIHSLKIVVYDGGRAEDKHGDSSIISDSGDDRADSKKSKLYSILNYNQTIKNKIKQATSPTAFYATQQGVALAVQTGREAINYFVSDIGRSTGDSNYQAIVNRKIEKVTDGLSVGQGMLSGAAAGASIGPVGAVIGAAVGAISAGVSLGFKYSERERAYQHEMFKENNSPAYQLARANYSALTGRVR